MLPKSAPRRRGQPPGMTASRLIKRIVIAGAVLQGIKIAQVARDLGVSRSWASREAHQPETHRFIARLKKQDPETAAAFFRRALKTIADQILDAEHTRAGKGILGQYDKAACQSSCERGGFWRHTTQAETTICIKLVAPEPQARQP